MGVLQNFGPVFSAMAVLAVGSAFFSCSEAALFSLKADDRRALRRGTAAQRLSYQLLSRPERLLMAILFWNLIINIAYFALASVVSIRLETDHRHTEAGTVAVVSLLLIILCSEMVPKTIGVLLPKLVSSVVGLPLAAAVRLFSPLAPVFEVVNRALRRLLFPNFIVEPYLELTDLERAITISTASEELAAQEHSALQNIVQLSDLRAEELMRPRTQYRTFTPPVLLDDLGGEPTRSGYILITEPDSEEIVGAIDLYQLPSVPKHHLEKSAVAVVYVPWCATAAMIFDELQSQQREVAAVVNELGESIGIVTLEDLLHTIFEDQASRSARLLETAPIRSVGEGLWQVTGITSLRRLSRYFQVPLPPSKSTSVTGIVQEQLQRIPEVDDVVDWPPFQFRVIETDPLGKTLVELRILERAEDDS